MSDNQFFQIAKLKLAKQADKDNTPVTEKTTQIETQNPSPSRPPKPSRQISHPSDWSDSEDGKDGQARAKLINVPHSQPNTLQDLQPSTSYANDTTPLRQLIPSQKYTPRLFRCMMIYQLNLDQENH